MLSQCSPLKSRRWLQRINHHLSCFQGINHPQPPPRDPCHQGAPLIHHNCLSTRKFLKPSCHQGCSNPLTPIRTASNLLCLLALYAHLLLILINLSHLIKQLGSNLPVINLHEQALGNQILRIKLSLPNGRMPLLVAAVPCWRRLAFHTLSLHPLLPLQPRPPLSSPSCHLLSPYPIRKGLLVHALAHAQTTCQSYPHHPVFQRMPH
jgi:hypothetical protein